MSLFINDEDDENEDNNFDFKNRKLIKDKDVTQNKHEIVVDSKEQDEKDEIEYPLILKEDADLIEQKEPIDITLSLPLHFQQLILEDLISDDSLLILGRGLGLEPITANLLHTLSAPATISNIKKRSLVILMGATEEENEKFEEKLTELQWIDDDQSEESKRSFLVITSDHYTSDKRLQLYQKGGIMSVTSRILIVDILSGILDAEKVTGLVILHAERVTDLSTESFIAFMFRQKNKWGFIKALSDDVEEFSTGFSPLQKKLKDLRLKKVLLWPRFHIEVTGSLINKDTKSVTEIRTLMTDYMKQIQAGLMECLKKCIDELKRKNPTLAIEYWSIENALDSKFLATIHMVFDPQWHRISYDSKQLVKDIKLLRDLLKCLISYDAVDFYEMIQLVLEANKPSVDRQNVESPWLMAEESQSVISHAKKRVFQNGDYYLEEQPKWEQLLLLLDEVVIERSHDITKKGPVLIMCSDDKVRRQLRQVISSSKEDPENNSYTFRKMMMNKLQRYLDSKEMKKSVTKTIQKVKQAEDESTELNISRAFARGPINTKRRRTRGGGAVARVDRLHSTLTAVDDIEGKINREEVDVELFELTMDDEADEQLEMDEEIHFLPETSIDHYEYINRENQIIIEKYDNKVDDQLLQELMPSFIIMYEPDLSFIRRVEVYQATNKHNPAKTYFIYYSNSIEEQRHLTAIRKEKEAFSKLIREKSTLASHFETDEDFNKFSIRKSQIMNTRIAGGSTFKDAKDESRIIVDTREFRAPLPGLLHRIGLRVVPVQLVVGDYILTPKVCVERKSISDLISSFKSGRIYEQCTRMTKYYELPTLLIEFDNNQSFSLESFSESRSRPSTIKVQHPSSSGRMQDEIQMNLALLVMKFPKLRILWSSSPYQTAELMLELKSEREEPDIIKAVNAGSQEGKKKLTDELSANIATLLHSVPSITSIDYYLIMKKAKNVEKLVNMSKEELQSLVGEDLGGRIHSLLLEHYTD